MMITRNIEGKTVSVVENHHEALEAWACSRNHLTMAPLLISLDYHTDSCEAFRRHSCEMAGYEVTKRDEMIALRHGLSDSVNYHNMDTIHHAIHLLRHDEHIDAAIKSDILDTAFLIVHNGNHTASVEEKEFNFNSMMGQVQAALSLSRHDDSTEISMCGPSRPFTYEMPDDRIFCIPHECYIGCNKQCHDEDCIRPYSDQVIESSFLQAELQVISEISRSVGLGDWCEREFILDIDLDYFRTAKSIDPDDPSMFHQLIKRSSLITVAMEATCVEDLRLPGETITSDSLIRRLVDHDAGAMTC